MRRACPPPRATVKNSPNDGDVVAKRSIWVFDATRFVPLAHTSKSEDSSPTWVEKLTRVGTVPFATRSRNQPRSP